MFSRRGQLRRGALIFVGVLAAWQVFFSTSRLSDTASSSEGEPGVNSNNRHLGGNDYNGDLIWKPKVDRDNNNIRVGGAIASGWNNHQRRKRPQRRTRYNPELSGADKNSPPSYTARSNLHPDPAKETILAPPPAGLETPRGAGGNYRGHGGPQAVPVGRQGVELLPPAPAAEQGPDTECPGLRKPVGVKDTHQWLRIGVANDTFVYSAFYETRFEQPKVRIVAITDTGKDHPRFCQVWYSSRAGPDIVKAVSDIVPETHSRRYAPFFYLCGLPTSDVPYAVSLVVERCDWPGHALLVLNTDAGNQGPDQHVDFTVCVTPLNNHYNRVNQLVEFMEVNRLFGAGKFVFYNHTTGPDVERYLAAFKLEGTVDVVPWNLPMQTDVWPPIPGINVEIHYFAQLASLNDCLYRYMYSSTYLVFIDLDEFIIPKVGNSWLEMVQHVSTKNTYHEPPVAYIIKNVFFRIDWPMDELLLHNQTVTRLNLLTLQVTKREKEIWPFKARSKYIVDPMGIDMVGVHNIWQFLPNVNEVMVDEDEAILHHYRNWESPQTGGPRIVDRTMHKYMDQIISATKARHKLVEKMYMHV